MHDLISHASKYPVFKAQDPRDQRADSPILCRARDAPYQTLQGMQRAVRAKTLARRPLGFCPALLRGPGPHSIGHSPPFLISTPPRFDWFLQNHNSFMAF